MFLDGVDGDDVRVVERGDAPGFPSEALQTVSVQRERIGKNLQRHITIQLRIARPVDLAHAASAEQGQNRVAAELPSDQGRGRVFSHHLRCCLPGSAAHPRQDGDRFTREANSQPAP